MKTDELFGKDLIKKLSKTHKSHANFSTDNREMKKAFKERINKPMLKCISDTIHKFGYDEEKNEINNFYDKVNSGNYDDADVEAFKELIEPYMDQIKEKLRTSGNLYGEEITKS